MGEDFQIVSDTVNNGVRHITAVPSALVCSRQIDFDIIDGRLRNVRYIRGCNGNLQAIGRLLEGMNARDAMELLSGIDCNARGTSCTDQLARVLKAIDLTSCR